MHKSTAIILGMPLALLGAVGITLMLNPALLPSAKPLLSDRSAASPHPHAEISPETQAAATLVPPLNGQALPKGLYLSPEQCAALHRDSCGCIHKGSKRGCCSRCRHRALIVPGSSR